MLLVGDEMKVLLVGDVWSFQHKLCVSRKLAYKPVIQDK